MIVNNGNFEHEADVISILMKKSEYVIAIPNICVTAIRTHFEGQS